MRTRFGLEPPPSVAVLIRRGLFAAAAWMPLLSTRSDVSRLRETRSQNYTGMYSFDGRCVVYLQKMITLLYYHYEHYSQTADRRTKF